MTKHKVLSTKILEPSLVRKAKGEGIEIIEKAAIRIEPIRTKQKKQQVLSLMEKNFKYAVFTSSNAVEALEKLMHNRNDFLSTQRKIFCLSGKTKESIQASAGRIGSIEETAPDAIELAKMIVAKGIKEVLFFCGNNRRDELPVILETNGVQVHEAVVYETIQTPVHLEDDVHAVLFFSPSAVQSFFSVNQLKKHTVCFAIGQTTAEAIKAYSKKKVIIGKAPTQKDLLIEVLNYFKNTAGGSK
jgi:uroporphyrinogen-III synthase